MARTNNVRGGNRGVLGNVTSGPVGDHNATRGGGQEGMDIAREAARRKGQEDYYNGKGEDFLKGDDKPGVENQADSAYGWATRGNGGNPLAKLIETGWVPEEQGRKEDGTFPKSYDVM